MKEQDAAHSKEFKYKRMETLHKINMQQLDELTRLRSELQQKDEVIKELMRFAFEVRNSTNLNQDGKVKVIKINSIIERATKILKQS